MRSKNTKLATAGDGAQYIEYIPAEVEELIKTRADIDALRGQPHTAADIAKLTQHLAATARQLGGYYLAAPGELLEAGENYYHEHAEQIRAALEQGGADVETIQAVLQDYRAALCGMTTHTATAQRMQNAIRACRPAIAFRIDKIGFYVGLLHCYQRNLNALTEYTRAVKQEPDANKRDLYFMRCVQCGEFTDLNAAALLWLQDIGYITASDFAGIETETIKRFLSYIDLFGHNGRFVQYVFTARNALNATEEQLAGLTPPPVFAGARIQAALNYAGIIGDEITAHLERAGGQSGPSAPGGSEPPTYETGTIEIRHVPKLNGKIVVPEECAIILGRPLYASTDGRQAREILPISAFIADFAAHNPAAMRVTPGVLEKTVEAVNLLQQLKRTAPANGIYTLETNLTEFSELCGYQDANEREKQNILTALHVLHNLYIVVWKPTGRVAVQLFGLQQYGLPNGGRERGLILNVFASGFRGRPQFWDAEQYALLRKKEKGTAMRHFRHQIGSKQHAKEDELLVQIFEYDRMRDEANRTNDAAQIAAVNEYIRKHKSRDKRRLRGWFDDWARAGHLTYSVRANKSGAIVYSWRRIPSATPEPGQDKAAE